MKKFTKLKLINFRFWFVIAISVIAGILFGMFVFISLAAKITCAIISSVLFAVLLGLAIRFKKLVLVTCCCVFLSLAVVFAGLSAKENSLANLARFNKSEVLVTGRISKNYSVTTSGNLLFALDNVTVVSETDYEEISGPIYVNVGPNNLNLSKFKIGEYVELIALINFYSLENTKNFSNISSGYVGYCYTYYNNIKFLGKSKLTVRDRVRGYVYDKLTESGTEYAEVGYAMLFGDSSKIDSEIKTIFNETGIAHVLAVSGLHVSIIVMILSFIFKKLKVPAKVRFAVSIVLLGFYAYLCAFSVSVIRASLMALTLSFCELRGKPYDKLSVLSFVAAIILLVNPVKLLSISFILSFGSVLSIVLLTPMLSRLLNKVIHERAASSLALYVSIQFGIAAIELYYFGRLPLLAVLSNVVTVPLIFVGFTYLIFSLIVALICPPLLFIIKPFGLLMSEIVKFNNYINGLGLAIISSAVPAVMILVYSLIMLFMSDHIFIKQRWKFNVFCVLVVSYSALKLFI